MPPWQRPLPFPPPPSPSPQLIMLDVRERRFHASAGAPHCRPRAHLFELRAKLLGRTRGGPSRHPPRPQSSAWRGPVCQARDAHERRPLEHLRALEPDARGREGERSGRRRLQKCAMLLGEGVVTVLQRLDDGEPMNLGTGHTRRVGPPLGQRVASPAPWARRWWQRRRRGDPARRRPRQMRRGTRERGGRSSRGSVGRQEAHGRDEMMHPGAERSVGARISAARFREDNRPYLLTARSRRRTRRRERLCVGPSP